MTQCMGSNNGMTIFNIGKKITERSALIGNVHIKWNERSIALNHRSIKKKLNKKDFSMKMNFLFIKMKKKMLFFQFLFIQLDNAIEKYMYGTIVTCNNNASYVL